MRREISKIEQAGHEFCNELYNSALTACDDRDPHVVHYYVSRARQIEGTLRTIARMQQA